MCQTAVALLGRLKFKDLELDFGRRLGEASAEAAVLPAPATGVTLPAGDETLLRLAAAAPRAAILESWLRLEAAALAAARRRGTTAHALGFEPSADVARDYVRLAARLEQSVAEREAAT